MTEIDEILAEITLEHADVSVCVRGDLAAKMARLERDLADLAASPDADTLAGVGAEVMSVVAELDQVTAEAAEFMRTFTVTAVPRETWRALARKFPPTEEQAAQGLDVDVDQFPYAAVALCATAPRMTLEQARRLGGCEFDPDDPESPKGLPEGQFDRIYQAVLSLNRGGGDLPKSLLATAARQAFAPRSTTRRSEGSRTASSPGA